MDNLSPDQSDINVIHTINEPAAAGAYEALKAVGKAKASADHVARRRLPGREGSLPESVGGTSQQYPLLMAARALKPSRNSPTPARSQASPKARTSLTPVLP